MLEWFLRTIGASDEFVTHSRDISVAFHHPHLLWLLALMVPAAYFIYARQRANLPSVPQRIIAALTATRVIVISLLIFVLAGPYLKLHHEYERRPVVALVFDQSQSMSLPAGPYEEAQLPAVARAAGYETPNDQVDAEARKALQRIARAKLAQLAVRQAKDDLLKPLSEKYDLRFYKFDREPSPLAVDRQTLELPEPDSPGGVSSYIGDALERVLDEAAGRSIAGVVLLSDGVNTGGRAPVEVARSARQLKAPLFAVPVGDPRRKSDVRLIDLFATPLVSVGDNVRVAATLESQGFDSRPIKLELREGSTVLDTKELTLRNEQQQIEFTFKADRAGTRYLSVVAPPQPEESEELHGNNIDSTFVRVSDEKLKTLLIDGTPRWDFRFLKNAIRRDNGLAGRAQAEPDVAVETELRRGTADAVAALLPTDVEELSKYHTIILGDVSAETLTPARLKALNEAVREHGVGLIVASGPHHMPHRFGDDLTDLLPVKLERAAAGAEADVYNPFRLKLTSEGNIHEAMRLYDDPGRTANVWTNMPPFYWSAAVARPSPGATVLAVNPARKGRYGELPLIAYHSAGEGRVLFVGTDSTWLWRQNVGDRFFYRFWGQMIRFVARTDEGPTKSRLEIRPVRAQPGEEAQIELYAFLPDGTPLSEPRVSVTIAGPGVPQSLELVEDPSTPGRYTAGYVPRDPGEYKVSFQAPGIAAIEAQLRVVQAPEELRQPHVDRAALERIALESEKGSLVELTDLRSIPSLLAEVETRFSSLDREKDVWDNWLMLVLLVVVYSIDVGLRRLAGLS